MGTYNGQKAAEYALKHALNYNGDWISEASANGGGGDCTNFLSQCLLAGGWTMIGGLRFDRHAWYNYDPKARDDRSYTWAGAKPMYGFLQRTERTRACTRIDLDVGDIVSGESATDGVTHHMLVTQIDKDRYDCWLSYHSSDKRNETIGTAAIQFKKLHYWKLLKSYGDQFMSDPIDGIVSLF